jgi:hypothetical protein
MFLSDGLIYWYYFIISVLHFNDYIQYFYRNFVLRFKELSAVIHFADT